MKQIHWFPGHMSRALREIREKIKLVDIIIELRDARIPFASANPEIKEIIGEKPHIVILTKKDLADITMTDKWITKLAEEGISAAAFNMRQDNMQKIVAMCHVELEEKFARDAARGMKRRPIRAMIVGIPNVGKSTFINRISNKRATTVGNKPGVTKKQQWIRLHKELELLDTPGVLWPRIDDPQAGLKLAAIGSIKDTILPLDTVVDYCYNFLQEHYPKAIHKRFKNVESQMTTDEALHTIGMERKILSKDGVPDREQVENLFMRELREGALGGITFDACDGSY